MTEHVIDLTVVRYVAPQSGFCMNTACCNPISEGRRAWKVGEHDSFCSQACAIKEQQELQAIAHQLLPMSTVVVDATLAT